MRKERFMKAAAWIAGAALLLSGCGSAAPAAATGQAPAAASQEAQAAGSGEAEKPIRIIATIFPAYDWVRSVLGDNPAGAEVTWLLEDGVDIHSYQPSAEDILKISTCDLFIYVGGESDRWVTDALKEAVNPDMKVISLLDAADDIALEEEITEGMQHDNDHKDNDHKDHDHDDHEDNDHEEEEDEHIWLSLRAAGILCGEITETLSEIDPDNASLYEKNAAAYAERLAELDGRYKEAAEQGQRDTILFADRFPFRYLTNDYGLTYYAAFAGCSAETEASFETILFLSEKVKELGLPVILTIDGSDGKIAETVRRTAELPDTEILTMDSMQSLIRKDEQEGVTYLSIMESNLEVLKKALGSR